MKKDMDFDGLYKSVAKPDEAFEYNTQNSGMGGLRKSTKVRKRGTKKRAERMTTLLVLTSIKMLIR